MVPNEKKKYSRESRKIFSHNATAANRHANYVEHVRVNSLVTPFRRNGSSVVLPGAKTF